MGIGSDLKRLDSIREEDIDTSDMPDLAEWVREAKPFRVATEEETSAAVRQVMASQAGVLELLRRE